MELWLPVPGKFKQRFQVSDLGRVKSVMRTGSRILKPCSNGNGYLFVGLCVGGKNHLRYVHRLVCLAFLGHCPKGFQVNHLDGNKSNNELENLEYTTHFENSQHAINNGLYVSGERSPLSKLDNRKVMSIRKLSRKGWSGVRLSDKFGVTTANISIVVNGKTWKGI